MDHDYSAVLKIKVMAADGSFREVVNQPPGTVDITGRVELASGNGVRIDTLDGAVRFQAGSEYLQPDAYYPAKLAAILAGGAFGTQTYSGAPYWLSRLENASPNINGDVSLLGDGCTQAPLVDIDIAAAVLRGDSGEIRLTDICPACIDCEDYDLAYRMLERIADFLDTNRDRNLRSGVRLFKQYQALVRYWNYMVNRHTMPFQVIGQGDNLFTVRIGYTSLHCGNLPGSGSAGNPICMTVRMVQTSGPECAFLAEETTGQRVPMDLAYTFEQLAPGFRICVEAMEYKNSLMADVGISVVQTGPDPSSGLSDDAEYDVTATWTDTHIGFTVSKTLHIKVPLA